jgi:nucleoside 2-deoxyribosyltransferase
MEPLKVYIAGKVSKDSVFGTHDWRDGFCSELEQLSGVKIQNLDPTRADSKFNLDENNAELIFGRDCYMIQQSDLVIVNLTDDISVGGSQEMLIAKYFGKPLIGIAPRGGKFIKDEKELAGRVFKNWMHAFVQYPCDALVENIKGVAEFIKAGLPQPGQIKQITLIDDAVAYYLNHHHASDTYLH